MWRLRVRLRWHGIVRHTACRVLGHRWRGKMYGSVCDRCVIFTPHRY